jgi:hypothetical protein
MTEPKSVFHWQGRPSIFSTGRDRADFVGINHRRAIRATANENVMSLSFMGGSKELPPGKMQRPRDVLVTGGELGAKK